MQMIENLRSQKSNDRKIAIIVVAQTMLLF